MVLITYCIEQEKRFNKPLRKSVRFPSKSKGKNQEICRVVTYGYDRSISESRFHGERHPFGGKGC